MNISKISRRLVVAIFVVFIIFLAFIDVKLLLNKDLVTASFVSNLIKIVYIIVTIILVLLYMYIKDKLNKLKVKRKIAYIYRYIYMSLVVIISSIIVLYTSFKNVSNIDILAYVFLTLLISIFIKRIIFNVSKSDILSVLAMFLYSMKIYPLNDINLMFSSKIMSLSFFVTLLILQILIDELKQRGVRTKKYIKLSVLLAFSISLNLSLGANIITYIVLGLMMIILTEGLDRTHISFPKKFVSSVSQARREKLYKIERININKLIVSISVILIISTIASVLIDIIIKNIHYEVCNSEIVKNIVENIDKNDISNLRLKISSNIINDMYNGFKQFIMTSRTYYMVLFVYIIGVEILALLLKRRYDTKSTVMKLIFVLMFMCVIIFKLNIYLYQPMFTTLLVLIAIVNTSNIYLNREERIKMLVA